MFITLLILGNGLLLQYCNSPSAMMLGILDQGYMILVQLIINFLISSLLIGWKEVSGVTSTVLLYSLNLWVDGNWALIFMIFSSK